MRSSETASGTTRVTGNGVSPLKGWPRRLFRGTTPLSEVRPRALTLDAAADAGYSVRMTLPPARVHYPHVDVRDDLMAGSPVVRGTKVPIRRLWAWHRRGVTVETLVKRYPSLGPAKVLCALAFAYDNEALVEADLDRERKLLDAEAEKVPGAMNQTKLPFGD